MTMSATGMPPEDFDDMDDLCGLPVTTTATATRRACRMPYCPNDVNAPHVICLDHQRAATPGMVLHWQGQLPRNRVGRVWRFYWWPSRTWAWEVRSTPGPAGYIATGNSLTPKLARLAAWTRAWGRGWHA